MAEIASFGVNIDENTLLAQNAQDSANDANKTGLDNNQSIKNINDPNYLSPFEKPQLQVQMDNFAIIYAADKNIATSEGIDFTAYDAVYQAYVAYMTPLVADITTYSPIVRSTFNSMVTAVQAEQKHFNAATQAQYSQQINKAQTDITNGQTKYQALQSDAETMKSSVAGIAEAASQAISSAGFASDAASAASQAADSAVASAMSAESSASSAVSIANSTASAFGPVKQSADSAFANAMSAQSDASNAVSQVSSAAADSKDAKQIAGAVSQSYKTLTDGSTMTIAELQNGLAAKLTKTDLNSYATQDWTQSQIKMTADGINGTMSSIKGTVDDHTTSINDFQADSEKFKAQFTTYKDTVDRHDKDIGTLQADSKSLSSNFDSLNTANGTNEHDISDLQQTAKKVTSTLETVQTQVQNSAVGTNLIVQSDLKNGYIDPDTGGVQSSNIDFHSDNYILTNGTIVFTLSSPDYVFKGNSGIDRLAMYDSDKNYLGYQSITSATQTLSNPNAAYIRFSINSGYEGNTTGNSSDWLANHRYKLEKGSVATDYSVNPEDTATVTAVSSISQTIDGMQTDISKKIEQKDLNGYATEDWTQNQIKITAEGIQTTVSDKVSSDQLTQLSGQLTNEIKDLSSSTSSQFTQTGKDINGLVKKGDVVNQFNLDAGGALLSTSGNSTKIVFSSPNIIFDSANPVQIPNVNIPGTLTGKTIEAAKITGTTKITGADIEAPIIHSPSGSFKLDGNTGDIIGASIHSADNSWGIDKNGIINGSTLNGATINTPTLDLGLNGTLTTDFNVSQPTSFYAPKKGTGTLTIKTGVINSSSQNMSRYSNTAAYWYGFDDNGNMVENGTNPTGDDYAPGYEKHDIMKSTGAVLNRSYLDAMGLMFTEGGNTTYNTMLTGVGLETAAALLHKDLATEGTFEAALGTGNKYGFSIGNHVIAPMIQANSYTYAANMFISSYGTMGSSTSTKANKLDIVDVPDMLQKGYNLLTINPRQWFDKTSVEAYADVQSGNSDSIKSVVNVKPVTGMVAEEVASAGLDDYVVKDENNKVQGLAYDRLWTLLLPVLRDMNDKINKLQKKEGI